MRKGKDVTDKETDASMENKNIKYNISKKVINFRLWNFRTSRCKAIWIRDISDETDTSQKRDINEHYEKYLEAIGPH